jgi:hypothetical protein
MRHVRLLVVTLVFSGKYNIAKSVELQLGEYIVFSLLLHQALIYLEHGFATGAKIIGTVICFGGNVLKKSLQRFW